MHQKQNLSSRNRRQKQGLTVTADVSQVLKTINNNTSWKNSSSKFTKTINPKTINPKHLIKNIMTQEDLDNLFNKSKEKIKTEVPCQQSDKWGNKTIRDFANSVTFLKMDDQVDRLLTGLPVKKQIDEDRIMSLFMEAKIDLTAQFKKNYLVGKVIGEGAYASVRVAIYKPLNRKIAIKVYEKNKIKDSQRKKSVRRQIRILQQLNHQNIVKIHDVVETNHHLNIIMQYLSGISLNSYLKMQPGNRATQKNCKKIIKALVQALKYLHERQISHRDIKLQNIILDQSISPKLIDFGFSTCIQQHKKVKIFCGTPSYMAPEIVQKRQYRGEPADIWALGVLFFVTLTGIFPFKGATDQELYKKINNSQYPKGQLVFSRQISDLMSKMLKINPYDRITAQQILLHPWMGNQPLPYKKFNKAQLSGDCRKRTTISSHKSKQKERQKDDNITNTRKLTETCKENLKIELRMMRQSPAKLDSTYTQRKMGKELVKALRGQKGILASINSKKQNNNKSNSKVLDLLRIQMKRRQENKSKGKIKKI